MGKWVAFRNHIAHRYAEIDFKEVYEIITTQLSDLDDFVEAIINYCHLRT
ncbi:MAG: HepT-like ribonuclease domain-containing protein [bacterium]